MKMLIFYSLLLLFSASLADEIIRKPIYKYRYETEDVMKTAESSVPIHGYHVVEGGYYPHEGDYRALGGSDYIGERIKHRPESFGEERFGGPTFRPGFGYREFIGPQIGYHQSLGFKRGFGSPHLGYSGVVDEGQFVKGNKNNNDEYYEKADGKKGQEINHGESGFSKNAAAAKDVKGDSGYHSDINGAKVIQENGKAYQGGHHFNKEGENQEEKTQKQGHKKGHKIKSFKTSHHKDESGNTEEYYDEAHDEGNTYASNGQKGDYGENHASQFKGGNQEEKYKAGKDKKEGYFNNEYSVDKANTDEKKYGGNKYGENLVLYGLSNDADEQSLLGHQESSKFHKSQPFIIPFHY